MADLDLYSLVEKHNTLVEQANQLLSRVVTAHDATTVIRQAEVARVLARQVKLGTAAINHATAVKLRAEIRLADIIEAGRAVGEIAPAEGGYRSPETGFIQPQTLAQLGVDFRRLAEARRLRNLGDTAEDAENAVTTAAAAATANGRQLSRAAIIAAIPHPNVPPPLEPAPPAGDIVMRYTRTPAQTALLRACQTIIDLGDAEPVLIGLDAPDDDDPAAAAEADVVWQTIVDTAKWLNRLLDLWDC